MAAMDWTMIGAIATGVAAIATLITAVVAVAIAVHADRKAMAVRLTRAELTAAGLITILGDTYNNIARMHSALEVREQEMLIEEKFPVMLPTYWDENMNDLRLDVLAELSPLPNNVANRLALALGMVHAVAREFRQHLNVPLGWKPMGKEVRFTHITNWQSRLKYAKESIDEVRKELDVVARTAGRRPVQLPSAKSVGST